jgi:hypothetical protein
MSSRNLPSITTPDGRRFYGSPLDRLVPCSETPFVRALVETLNGVAEVVLPAGRADVATDIDVFEVEPVKRWRHGVRQAFAYAGMSGLRPNLALFGKADYLDIYLKIRDTMPGMVLWVWHANGWVRITNRRLALTAPHPPRRRPARRFSKETVYEDRFGLVDRLRSLGVPVEPLLTARTSVDMAGAVGKVLNALPDVHSKLRAMRQQAVLELREQGRSLAEIGELLGLHRNRVQQIAEGRVGGGKGGGSAA